MRICPKPQGDYPNSSKSDASQICWTEGNLLELEEEPAAALHHALSDLAVDAAKVRMISWPFVASQKPAPV